MISLEHISQAYGEQEILKDVSLVLPERKITALMGSNGAGKSTLLNAAANLIPIKKGEIFIDDENIKKMKNMEIAKVLAVLKQTQNANMQITVKELVSFGRYPHCKGRIGKIDEEKIEEAINYMNLNKIQDRFITELSGGQRQRAYIAMVLAQDTKYIFLDEPLNNLDVKYSIEMMEGLQKLVQDLEKTVIIVLHDVNFAASFADEIVAMKDGKIIQQGNTDEIINKEILSVVFEHDFHIVEIGHRKVCVYFQPEVV